MGRACLPLRQADVTAGRRPRHPSRAARLHCQPDRRGIVEARRGDPLRSAGLRRLLHARRQGSESGRNLPVAGPCGDARKHRRNVGAIVLHRRIGGEDRCRRPTARGGPVIEDLGNHRAEWVSTLSCAYADAVVHELPPNGQGIATLMGLGILAASEHGGSSADDPQEVHLTIEAMKLAMADLYRYVGDVDAMPFSPEVLLDPDYLASRARLIDPEVAGDPAHGAPRPGGTVCLSAADESGMMISFIQSNYMGFGSGVVIPGTGISLQNRGGRVFVGPGPSQPGRPQQEAISNHNPRFCNDCRRPPSYRLRPDGRLNAGAGPSAAHEPHPEASPKSAGRSRCAALARARRTRGCGGAGYGRGIDRGSRAQGAQDHHRTTGQLVRIWRCADRHADGRGRICRRIRRPQGWDGYCAMKTGRQFVGLLLSRFQLSHHIGR